MRTAPQLHDEAASLPCPSVAGESAIQKQWVKLSKQIDGNVEFDLEVLNSHHNCRKKKKTPSVPRMTSSVDSAVRKETKKQ